MDTTVVAEAGLSECVREGACDPNFGQVLAMVGAAWLLVAVWLGVSVYATADILTSKVGLAHIVLWLLVVWMLPIVGAITWIRNAAVTARSTQRPSIMTPALPPPTSATEPGWILTLRVGSRLRIKQ